MRAGYTRIIADADGASRFADADIELNVGFAVPPAEPLHFAPFFASEGTFWLGGTSDWRGDAPHPAPRRAIFITVKGEYEVTTSDGAVRRFPPGSVLLLEDTTGQGHSTKLVGSEQCIAFAIGLPALNAGS